MCSWKILPYEKNWGFFLGKPFSRTDCQWKECPKNGSFVEYTGIKKNREDHLLSYTGFMRVNVYKTR